MPNQSPNLPPRHTLTTPGFAGSEGARGGVGLDIFNNRYITIRMVQEIETELKMLQDTEKDLRNKIHYIRMDHWLWAEYRWLLRRVEEKLYGKNL